MTKPETQNHLEEDISIHVFSGSATLVGVCLTVVGIVRFVSIANAIDTFIDDLLLMGALFFLISCLLSYWALRTRNKHRMRLVEYFADTLFILGLLLVVGITGLLVYYLV